MTATDDHARYGDLWADIYDDEHSFLDPSPTAALLAELAGTGPALELAIGTGRVALPLAQRGVDVRGIDVSEAMVAQLRAKPGGDAIDVTMGDMASTPLGGPYRLVYLVFNTLFGLLTQERQIACFHNVAASLSPDGAFVIECFVPDVARFDRQGNHLGLATIDEERIRVNASHHDAVTQRVTAQVVMLRDGSVSMRPVSLRYSWPSELDLMAQMAGLALADRWGGWEREPFTSESGKHVSVYRRPAA
jgi:SAM-dependent methyltransferase